jgi:hypothetical protein
MTATFVVYKTTIDYIMKTITFYLLLVLMLVAGASASASNWQWDGQKWVKDITPSILKFTNYQTTDMQSEIFPVLGGANPNPAITTSSGHNLSDGYFAVSGGQILQADVDNPANVRQAFSITTDSATLGAGLLRRMEYCYL